MTRKIDWSIFGLWLAFIVVILQLFVAAVIAILRLYGVKP